MQLIGGTYIAYACFRDRLTFLCCSVSATMEVLTANASAPLAPLITSTQDSTWQLPLNTKLVTTLALLLISFFGYYWGNSDRAYRGFPLVGKKKNEWSNKSAKIRWATQGVEVVKQGLDEVSRDKLSDLALESATRNLIDGSD